MNRNPRERGCKPFATVDVNAGIGIYRQAVSRRRSRTLTPVADPGNKKEGFQRPRTITRILAKEIADCVKLNIE